ncbi:MAG: hypothetical protein LUH14_08020 [Clostridiaceae bacterium]|nr:hypothetical protein [Clostridiaceae bacterium]
MFLALFWIQNRGVEQARSTDMLRSIYAEIEGKITEEKAEKIEALKKEKDEILEKEATVEQEYKEEKIEIDEYMRYRDDYHYMNSRSEIIDAVYERYQTNRKQGAWMIFDRYYEQLFQPERNQWGLILSVFFIISLLVCCETQEFSSVIYVTRKGKCGIWKDKLKTVMMSGVILTVLYAAGECAIVSMFFSFDYLEAPVQSISCLADVQLTVNIGQWYILTFLLRMLNIVVFSGAGCFILLHTKNKKIGILVMAVVIFLPMILAEVMQWDVCNVLSKWITVYPLFV